MPHPSMIWLACSALFIAIPQSLVGQQPAEAEAISWHDVTEWGLEGRLLPEETSQHWFDRFPAAASNKVTKNVWNLSRDSAGMVFRFTTDSPAIHIHYKLRKQQLAMPHMPATGVSGVDLYARDQTGNWRWVQVTKPTQQEIKQPMINGLAAGEREYAAYLPLYNGVEFMSIGVDAGASFKSQ